MKHARKPNFLLVGVQKTGTTFLAKRLAAHPEVFFAKPKEVFFFNKPKIELPEFNEYLREYFQPGRGIRWRGEGSTNYFHHPAAINHIEKYLGRSTRIIVCLRHPVERMLSHYLHDFKRGRRNGTEVPGDSSWKGYMSRSFYADRLELWSQRFPNFKPLVFDDLVRSGRDFYTEAAAFLEIEPEDVADEAVNEGVRMGWEGDTLTTLSAPPGPEQVAPRFAREDVEAMVAAFAPDVRRTMDFLGRDLSSWLKMPDFRLLQQKLELEARAS